MASETGSASAPEGRRLTDETSDSLFYMGAGPMAAIVLGIALTPLRGFTTASNSTFLFLALTIVVAEFGGRWAAVATAVTSALSLDFFLTQPYLTLAIDDKHDMIAFVGLALCGLVAAALGSKRGERSAALEAARKRLELFHSFSSGWQPGPPSEPQLAKLLREMRGAFPLGGLVLRDTRGYVIASADSSDGLRSLPEAILQADTLLADDSTSQLVSRGLVFPPDGGRIALAVGEEPLGWLDVWGNGAPAGAEARRLLADCARLLALLLALGEPASGPASDSLS